jgi:hypothetical protein
MATHCKRDADDSRHPNDHYTACDINVPKKDGGISVVAKKRSAIGTFF